jgi:CRP-like cAMP-binding protein
MAVEDTLANIELFSELDKDEIARIAKTAVVRDFQKGDVIVRENEAGVALYIIARGTVDIVKGLGSGNEQKLAELADGSFFGEMALFDNEVRSASVRAAENTQCIVITKWDFNAELSQNADLAMKLLAVLARRIRSLQEEVTH